jgi:hypothetical protein
LVVIGQIQDQGLPGRCCWPDPRPVLY